MWKMKLPLLYAIRLAFGDHAGSSRLGIVVAPLSINVRFVPSASIVPTL